MTFIKGLYNLLHYEKIKNGHLFLGFVIINLLASVIFQEFVITKEVYQSLLSERLEAYRINRQLELINHVKVWGYFLLPIILWIKYTLVSLLLQLPLMLKFIEIPFKHIYRVVMLASIALVIMNLVQIACLFSIPNDQISDITIKLIPLSLNELIDVSHYSNSTINFFNNINLFELLWLILIFIGFNFIANGKLKKIDLAILILGVWAFLLVLQYAVLVYIEQSFS